MPRGIFIRKLRPLAERFLEKVVRTDNCWGWTASRNPNGYGQIGGRDRHLLLAHRVSYELFVGTIPDGMCVLHRCDNPSCTNPAHLRLGTKADNSRDMREKGRSRGGGLWGEANPAAKLTAAQVRSIRIDLANGHAIRAIARAYGRSQRCIQHIARGTHWRN
jgi:hypothetical protein